MTVPGSGGGLGGATMPSGQIRVGFRSGWVRTLAISIGGFSLVGLAYAIARMAQQDSVGVIGLLYRWGFLWLLVLAAMGFLWDLAKIGLGYLGKLAGSVQDSAVAMTRIADRDDRERDRMATETAYLGQRMEKLSSDVGELRSGQREVLIGLQDNHREVLDILKKCGAMDAHELRGEHECS